MSKRPFDYQNSNNITIVPTMDFCSYPAVKRSKLENGTASASQLHKGFQNTPGSSPELQRLDWNATVSLPTPPGCKSSENFPVEMDRREFISGVRKVSVSKHGSTLQINPASLESGPQNDNQESSDHNEDLDDHPKTSDSWASNMMPSIGAIRKTPIKLNLSLKKRNASSENGSAALKTPIAIPPPANKNEKEPPIKKPIRTDPPISNYTGSTPLVSLQKNTTIAQNTIIANPNDKKAKVDDRAYPNYSANQCDKKYNTQKRFASTYKIPKLSSRCKSDTSHSPTESCDCVNKLQHQSTFEPVIKANHSESKRRRVSEEYLRKNDDTVKGIDVKGHKEKNPVASYTTTRKPAAVTVRRQSSIHPTHKVNDQIEGDHKNGKHRDADRLIAKDRSLTKSGQSSKNAKHKTNDKSMAQPENKKHRGNSATNQQTKSSTADSGHKHKNKINEPTTKHSHSHNSSAAGKSKMQLQNKSSTKHDKISSENSENLKSETENFVSKASARSKDIKFSKNNNKDMTNILHEMTNSKSAKSKDYASEDGEITIDDVDKHKSVIKSVVQKIVKDVSALTFLRSKTTKYPEGPESVTEETVKSGRIDDLREKLSQRTLNKYFTRINNTVRRDRNEIETEHKDRDNLIITVPNEKEMDNEKSEGEIRKYLNQKEKKVAKTKKPKKLKVVINIQYEDDDKSPSSGSDNEQSDESATDGSNLDISFLDNINIDEIVNCMIHSENTTNNDYVPEASNLTNATSVGESERFSSPIENTNRTEETIGNDSAQNTVNDTDTKDELKEIQRFLSATSEENNDESLNERYRSNLQDTKFPSNETLILECKEELPERIGDVNVTENPLDDAKELINNVPAPVLRVKTVTELNLDASQIRQDNLEKESGISAGDASNSTDDRTAEEVSPILLSDKTEPEISDVIVINSDDEPDVIQISDTEDNFNHKKKIVYTKSKSQDSLSENIAEQKLPDTTIETEEERENKELIQNTLVNAQINIAVTNIAAVLEENTGMETSVEIKTEAEDIISKKHESDLNTSDTIASNLMHTAPQADPEAQEIETAIETENKCLSEKTLESAPIYPNIPRVNEGSPKRNLVPETPIENNLSRTEEPFLDNTDASKLTHANPQAESAAVAIETEVEVMGVNEGPCEENVGVETPMEPTTEVENQLSKSQESDQHDASTLTHATSQAESKVLVIETEVGADNILGSSKGDIGKETPMVTEEEVENNKSKKESDQNTSDDGKLTLATSQFESNILAIKAEAEDKKKCLDENTDKHNKTCNQADSSAINNKVLSNEPTVKATCSSEFKKENAFTKEHVPQTTKRNLPMFESDRPESNIQMFQHDHYRKIEFEDMLPPDQAMAKHLEERMSDYFMKKDFVVTAFIRKGRFSKIYQCKDLRGKNYAVKIISNVKERYNLGILQEEMLKQIQKDIPKENLTFVHLIDGFGFQNRWCFLMEYCSKNLFQVMQEGGTSLHIDRVQILARQLASAVTVLRNNNIVHSEIRPGHIFVDASDRLKLCGFERAYYDEPKPGPFAPNIATPSYRAPEVIMGHSKSFSIDVWSTALVIFEMATNRVMFPGPITNNELLFLQQCHFGSMPSDMINNSWYKHNHFFGLKFMRHRFVPPKPYPKFYRPKNRIGKALQEAYWRDWGTLRRSTKQQRSHDIAKTKQLAGLLSEMLVLHPRERMPIEFVYANFLYS